MPGAATPALACSPLATNASETKIMAKAMKLNFFIL
jgi:hypothetical protein